MGCTGKKFALHQQVFRGPLSVLDTLRRRMEIWKTKTSWVPRGRRLADCFRADFLEKRGTRRLKADPACASMAPHTERQAWMYRIKRILEWILCATRDARDVTGFKAVVSWSQRPHDGIALHELARLDDELGHALLRCQTPVRDRGCGCTPT